MAEAGPTRATQIGTALAGFGGAGAVAQAFLAWREPNLGYPPNGGDYPEGVAIAWLGVVVLAVFAGWGMRNRLYDVAGWALILGILIGVLAIRDVLVLDAVGRGLYLAAASGVLTVTGALLAVLGHREDPPE